MQSEVYKWTGRLRGHFVCIKVVSGNHACPGFLSATVINTTAQSSVGRKKLISFTVYKSILEGSKSKNWEAGRKQKSGWSYLLVWFDLRRHNQLLFLCSPGLPALMVLQLTGLSPHHQSASENIHSDHAHGMFWWRQFFSWRSFFSGCEINKD